MGHFSYNIIFFLQIFTIFKNSYLKIFPGKLLFAEKILLILKDMRDKTKFSLTYTCVQVPAWSDRPRAPAVAHPVDPGQTGIPNTGV